jgi:hypothetical protein
MRGRGYPPNPCAAGVTGGRAIRKSWRRLETTMERVYSPDDPLDGTNIRA